VLSGVQGGFFLRKKPLGILLSLYTNWKNALAALFSRDSLGTEVPTVMHMALII
jgi:hypothetical protein